MGKARPKWHAYSFWMPGCEQSHVARYCIVWHWTRTHRKISENKKRNKLEAHHYGTWESLEVLMHLLAAADYFIGGCCGKHLPGNKRIFLQGERFEISWIVLGRCMSCHK